MCPTPSSDSRNAPLRDRVRSGLARGAIVAAYALVLAVVVLDIHERVRMDYGRGAAFVAFVDGTALVALLATPVTAARWAPKPWRSFAMLVVVWWILVVIWTSWVHCLWGSWELACYPWRSYLSPL